jgi:hypothetical protein
MFEMYLMIIENSKTLFKHYNQCFFAIFASCEQFEFFLIWHNHEQ